MNDYIAVCIKTELELNLLIKLTALKGFSYEPSDKLKTPTYFVVRTRTRLPKVSFLSNYDYKDITTIATNIDEFLRLLGIEPTPLLKTLFYSNKETSK